MAFRINGDCLTINSQFAWASWIACGFFLLVFPLAIWAMWRAGPETIPLWFNLIFTLLFAISVPFFVKEIAGARIVRAWLDRTSGRIVIKIFGLRKRTSSVHVFDDIDRVEMEVSDNDGYFYTLNLVLHNDCRVPFLHGNHRPGIEKERDRFLDFIRQTRPDVAAVERNV